MRPLFATLLAAGLLAGAALLHAQQPPPAPAEPADARIARLIADLDSKRFAVRERATRELMALKAEAIEPLEKALGQASSVEVLRRIRAILETLAIYQPGGDVVDGLKLRLTADRAAVKMGETVNLRTVLCNMTEKPLNVYIGYTYCGTYFECGSALHRAAPVVKGKLLSDTPARCEVGFCGTGAGPIYVTVQPKSLVGFHTPATLMEKNGKKGYALGKGRFFFLDSAGGDEAVRMVLTVTPGDNVRRPARPGLKGSGIRPAKEDALFWTGTLRSNDVRIKLAQ
jgi:hypothetical protein